MLINCVAYENGSRLADLTIGEISDYLARPDCFVWVALADATPEELDMMKEEFALHELAVEDARHGHQRPKIEDYGDIKVVNSAGKIRVSLNCTFRNEYSFDEVHDVVTILESKLYLHLKESYPNLSNVIIHAEPTNIES